MINMIENSLLDSKLNALISTAKSKVQTLTQETLALERENTQLQDLVTVAFQDQGNLMVEINALESQLKQIRNINENLKDERNEAFEKVRKAEDDFMNVTKAYQQQENKIHSEMEELKDWEKKFRDMRKFREENHSKEMEKLKKRYEELKKSIKGCEESNVEVKRQLLEIELKDAYRINSLEEELRNFC
ncbi:unnamed protein product [Blepharisma stoltei]|uniref:Uncharacterized protein n=1 Tax=Blepharisma stoltei TaxID=1481888 RepID=A0AAU9J927_9CILI|nr:unnamed protein product [Blepharisma stoltei]